MNNNHTVTKKFILIRLLVCIFFFAKTIHIQTSQQILKQPSSFSTEKAYIDYLTKINSPDAIQKIFSYATQKGDLSLSIATLNAYNIHNTETFSAIIGPQNFNKMRGDIYYDPFNILPNPLDSQPLGTCFFKLFLEYNCWDALINDKISSNSIPECLLALGFCVIFNFAQQFTIKQEIFTTYLSYGADPNKPLSTKYLTPACSSIQNGKSFFQILSPTSLLYKQAQQWSGGKTFDQTKTNLLPSLLQKISMPNVVLEEALTEIQQAIDNGADPNAYIALNNDDFTALHYAILLGSTDISYPVYEVVNTLLNAAEKNNCRIATNKVSKIKRISPLSSLVNYKNNRPADDTGKTVTCNLIDLLMSHNADALAKDVNGKSAYEYSLFLKNSNKNDSYFSDIFNEIINGMTNYDPHQLVIASYDNISLATIGSMANNASETNATVDATSLNETNADVYALINKTAKPTLQSLIDIIKSIKTCNDFNTIKHNLQPILSQYIDDGGSLDDKDSTQQTLFNYATNSKCPTDIADYLTDFKSSLDNQGNTRSLENATVTFDLLKDLIVKNEWGPDSVTYAQFSTMLEDYLKKNDINTVDDLFGFTLLCYALYRGTDQQTKLPKPIDINIIKILIEHGAHINGFYGNGNRLIADQGLNSYLASGKEFTFRNTICAINKQHPVCGKTNISLNFFSTTTPLGLAIFSRSLDAVNYILSRPDAYIYELNPYVNTNINKDTLNKEKMFDIHSPIDTQNPVIFHIEPNLQPYTSAYFIAQFIGIKEIKAVFDKIHKDKTDYWKALSNKTTMPGTLYYGYPDYGTLDCHYVSNSKKEKWFRVSLPDNKRGLVRKLMFEINDSNEIILTFYKDQSNEQIGSYTFAHEKELLSTPDIIVKS